MDRILTKDRGNCYLVIETEEEDIFGLNFITLDEQRQKEVMNFAEFQMSLMRNEFGQQYNN